MSENQVDKRIVCSLVEVDGTVKYLVVDTGTGKCERLSYDETVSCVLSHKITNARMENTVIKIVDTVWNQSQLRCYNTDKAEMYYIFDSYKTKYGTYMIVLVSNTSELFELSENVAVKLLGKEDVLLINATINNNKVKVVTNRGYTTALSRSYAMTCNTHH